MLRGLGVSLLISLTSISTIGTRLVWAQQSGFAATIEDVPPSESGLTFQHTDGGSGKRYIMESVIGSLALFDYDMDGFIDIYLLNGAALQGSTIEPPPSNHLYRNNGDWTFTDVTAEAGVGDTGYGMGVVVADYDEDGDPDLMISNFGTNSFYVNNGDGSFTEQAEWAGVRGPSRFGAGNAFFDMDRDGDLDLYCASYVEFDYRQYKVRTIAGHQFHAGPIDYEPAADLLFRNEGDGRFTNVSEAAGIAALRAPGMGVLAADFDGDGDDDIFVANDQQANMLLTNDGHGRFVDDGIAAGIAFDRLGRANGNMGIDYADLNGDGLLDLVTTTYQDEMPVYYQALGGGLFNDATNIARLDPTLKPHVNWGVGAVDFDNDADLDLYIACGHFLDNIRFIDDRTDVRVRDYLLANDGAGKFSNATASAGSLFERVESGRGAGFDDLDNDGDVDVVVLNFNAQAMLGRTISPPSNRSISLRLVGTTSNRSAVGSQVMVSAGGSKQHFVSVAGKGYASSYGERIVVGLGAEEGLGEIAAQVTWPSGRQEVYNLPEPPFSGPKKTFTLIEGEGFELTAGK